MDAINSHVYAVDFSFLYLTNCGNTQLNFLIELSHDFLHFLLNSTAKPCYNYNSSNSRGSVYLRLLRDVAYQQYAQQANNDKWQIYCRLHSRTKTLACGKNSLDINEVNNYFIYSQLQTTHVDPGDSQLSNGLSSFPFAILNEIVPSKGLHIVKPLSK